MKGHSINLSWGAEDLDKEAAKKKKMEGQIWFKKELGRKGYRANS